ncbi:uncharacterized protein [Mytilus edulis]|uniref:uncharacterized protein isoform X2 n=1 Tax=Mytilus edulis TaxID=6550 RepID=UPI0039EE6C43
MNEKASTSAGIKVQIPPELQNQIDEIALKHPREAAISSDLDDDQKRWLVVGICLHSVISPALRKYVDSILTICYNELIHNYKIDTQIYPGHLQRDPQTGIFLNYEAVNNNKASYCKNVAKYDYTIKNAVDLSKLFLQTHMAHYTCFDETCDSSALLGLIINIARFDPVIKSDADDVRKTIRNPWAHCHFSEWDAAKYSNSFQQMKKLVKDLKLSINEETLTIEEMEKWEINGQHFLSETTHGLELLNEFRQETHVLAVYATLVAEGTDDQFVRIKNELKQFEIILNEIAQLDEGMKKGFSDIDKKFSTQDKTLKKHATQIGNKSLPLSLIFSDFHNVDIERWKDQDIMFVETPVVKRITQILESNQSVLLVGEPGIGKSMLMHHLVLQLHNKNAYSIIPCSEIKDIRYQFRKDMRQMFVLDDICGRFTVSLNDIEYMQKNEDSLKRMLEKGESKIVATCRLDIYNDEKFHKLCSLFKSIFNVSVEYSKEDKLAICTEYLNQINIQLLRDQNVAFTPLMCYLYCKNENFCLTDFLHSPYDTYRQEWETLQSIDPYKYCALLLCVVFNGIIKESLFDIYNENNTIDKKVLEHCFEICTIGRDTSIILMKKVFDRLVGTYLQKTKNQYWVLHDQMFDFLCCYFGNNDAFVRCILRHADIKVFNERTQLESINEPYGKFTIIISGKYENAYFERIKNDLQFGKLTQCLCNAQMKHENYRSLFLNVLKSLDNNYFIDNHIIKKNIITSCYRGYYEIVEYLMSKNIDLNEGYSYHTTLAAACNIRNEKLVQLLIDKGCDVNQVVGLFDTPLIAACNNGNERIVQLLIDNGGDVNLVNAIGDTPLTAACNNGNAKIVQLLIDKGCEVNHVGSLETPLTVSCKRGNERIVQLLIAKGGDVKQANGIGQTPLTVACYSENEKIVQLLLDKGCAINTADGIGETPLTAACKKGNENIVQLLINKGGDVNNIDGMTDTPLRVACKSGSQKIVQLLIDKGSAVDQVNGLGETLLTAACKGGNLKIVQLFIDKGCDINRGYSIGQTPMTAACMRGYEKIIHLLIASGSNVYEDDGMRDTPLIAACKGRNEKIVQLLIDKGCDVHQVDGLLETTLTAACSSGNENLVHLLINKECDVNQPNGRGVTPLLAACLVGNEKIVEILIDKGCDVHMADSMCQTTLIASVESRNLKLVQLLIDKGCDVNKSGLVQTPLIAACWRGYEKIAKLLIDNGSDVNQGNIMRDTPLTVARSREHQNIVQLLICKGYNVNEIDVKGETHA